VDVIGAGISYIDIVIRNKTNHTITVGIPLSTYFISNSSSTQNMIATEER